MQKATFSPYSREFNFCMTNNSPFYLINLIAILQFSTHLKLSSNKLLHNTRDNTKYDKTSINSKGMSLWTPAHYVRAMLCKVFHTESQIGVEYLPLQNEFSTRNGAASRSYIAINDNN